MKRRIDSTKFLLIVFFLSGLFFVFCSLTVEAQSIGTVWGAKRDSVLTINKRIQKLADRLLENKQGSIVALDPTTGEILCMSSSSFDTDTINRAVSVTYEPGSTFKIAQALAQLSEGELNEGRYYSCHKGFWQDNIHIGCHKHHSPLKLIDALANSCNSYFCRSFIHMIDDRIKYPSKLDAINTWRSYMLSMGLGNKLGTDVPGEVGGLMPSAKYLETFYNHRWTSTTIMWVGMGQGGVKVTNLQLANLCACIANRGWYITPHIHKYAPLANCQLHQAIVTPESYETVIKGMRGAVTRGTCTEINTPDYSICGKTGTSENAGPDHSLFVGFAPMNNPRIVVSVIIENGGWGADFAAPLAALIMEQYLKGHLSASSKRHADKWQHYICVPYTSDDISTGK
jgi:penicillin-binding protein 2